MSRFVDQLHNMGYKNLISFIRELSSTLTIEQVDRVLVRLGSDSYLDHRNNSRTVNNKNPFVSYQTVCHNGDSYNLKYFLNKHQFYCYTGCKKKYDIIALVTIALNVKAIRAIEYTVEVCGLSNSEIKLIYKTIGLKLKKTTKVESSSIESFGDMLSDEDLGLVPEYYVSNDDSEIGDDDSFELVMLEEDSDTESYYEDIIMMKRMSKENNCVANISNISNISHNATQDNCEPQIEQKCYESILGHYSPKMKLEWRREGILLHTFQLFGCRTDSQKHRVIIPHKNAEGEYVGIRVRNFESKHLEGKVRRKYVPLTTKMETSDELGNKSDKLVTLSHPTGDHLYGFYENKETIRKRQRIIIFEGEKSVLKMHSIFGDNESVAVCGGTLSTAGVKFNQQLKIILESGAKEIIIAYDKLFEGDIGSDEEYNERKKLGERLAIWKTMFNVGVIWDMNGLLKKGDSPIDLGKEVFEELMKECVVMIS